MAYWEPITRARRGPPRPGREHVRRRHRRHRAASPRTRAPRGWWICVPHSPLTFAGIFIDLRRLPLLAGRRRLGKHSPVYWAWDITNFVWWVGIGHAGTLISAILFLFRQKWRTAINRFAEAMTIFAVICALIFPGIHVGRAVVRVLHVPAPEPDDALAELQEPARSGTCSRSARTSRSRCSSGTSGLIPDLATLRDRSTTKWRQRIYGVLRPRLARLEPPLAELRARVPDPRRPSRRRSCSACTASSRSTSRRRSSPAGTRRSSRRTSSPAPSSAASRWSRRCSSSRARSSSCSASS